jgi:hypothetical protein
MPLRFIAKDPETGSNASPTVWVDEQNADMVFQGWKINDDTTKECLEVGTIPDHETVIRIPARMVSIVREACDVAERRAGVQEAAG